MLEGDKADSSIDGQDKEILKNGFIFLEAKNDAVICPLRLLSITDQQTAS